MQTFWFRKRKTQEKRWKRFVSVYGVFSLVTLFFIFLFGIAGVRVWWLYTMYNDSDISHLLEKNEMYSSLIGWFQSQWSHDILSFTETLLDVWSIYLWNWYHSWEWSLFTSLRIWLQNNEEKILEYLPERYHEQFSLVMELLTFNEDLVSLAWFESAQTYLVLLQNTAERRPNGWFFWSFAVVKIADGKVIDLEVRDSYILDYEPDMLWTQLWERADSNDEYLSIQWPAWLEWYLPSREIHFVWANKIWFTYHDGAHIKQLYEKKYPNESIRGVGFLRTDMLEQLIPWFQKQLRERQFTNAATDLIRGQNLFWKKEFYQQWVTDLLDEHKGDLIEAFLQNLPELIDQRLLNIYLTDISVSWWLVWWWLKWRLQEKKLVTRFERDHMYVRWSNTSFNKIDTFVTGMVQIKDQSGVVLIEYPKTWILPLDDLPVWTYEIQVTYTMDIPYEYHSLISWFEAKYAITLGDRERHILGLKHIWQNRWLLYLPDSYEILEISWETILSGTFTTPFEANGAWYMMNIQENGGSTSVTLTVKKN